MQVRWTKCSGEIKWQALFLALNLGNELPDDIRKKVIAKYGKNIQGDPNQPVTPPRKGQGTKQPSDEQQPTGMSPEAPERVPARVAGCRPAKFGQPPKLDTKLKAAGSKLDKPDSGSKAAQDPDADLKIDSGEEASTGLEHILAWIHIWWYILQQSDH